MNMNRIMTAFALSGLLIGAPAFAKSHKPVVATAGDKGADKASETKAEGSETKTETAKPKKTKKVKKTEEAKPAEAPAK
jgi:hypothetical protein